jgi:hypothetical protein
VVRSAADLESTTSGTAATNLLRHMAVPESTPGGWRSDAEVEQAAVTERNTFQREEIGFVEACEQGAGASEASPSEAAGADRQQIQPARASGLVCGTAHSKLSHGNGESYARFVTSTAAGELAWLECRESSEAVCLHSCRLGADVYSSPVAFGDYVVIGCRDEHLYCLELLELSTPVPVHKTVL